MNQWGFWEIISPEAAAALWAYQREHFGTRLDEPVFNFHGNTAASVHYPDAEESGRNMHKVIGEISPNKTKGIS